MKIERYVMCETGTREKTLDKESVENIVAK